MFAPTTAARVQFASIARISGPLIINFLAVAGMNLADVMMSGRLGADALAAVAVGSSTWMLAFSACLGLLMALSPIISRLYGAGEEHKIGRYARHGMYLGFGLGGGAVLPSRHRGRSLRAARRRGGRPRPGRELDGG